MSYALVWDLIRLKDFSDSEKCTSLVEPLLFVPVNHTGAFLLQQSHWLTLECSICNSVMFVYPLVVCFPTMMNLCCSIGAKDYLSRFSWNCLEDESLVGISGWIFVFAAEYMYIML